MSTPTIRAIRLQQPGGPEVLEYVELPLPEPGPQEIRVRAQAIGVGKPDVLIRQGVYRWMPPLPAIPGNELAGIVEARGSGVTTFDVGDRVLVSSRELPRRGGCYAEAVCVPAASAYPLPDAIAASDAVCLANYQLAGALLHESGVRPPHSILIHGAAGGVAIALMQFAAAHDILAIGVASSERKCAFAREAGAKHVIDKSTQEIGTEVEHITDGRGVDMVLDHVAGPGFTDNLAYLAPLGTLMSYNVLAGLPEENLLEALRRFGSMSLGVRCYSIHTLDRAPAKRRELMQRAIDLASSGVIKPPAPTRLPLSEARHAHEMLDAAEVLGKIVLIPG